MILRLTDAQQSALECALVTEEDEPYLSRCWDGVGTLAAEPRDFAGLASELTDLANVEDEYAQNPVLDAEQRRHCRRARDVLTRLAAKMLRLEKGERR